VIQAETKKEKKKERFFEFGGSSREFAKTNQNELEQNREFQKDLTF